MQYNILAKKRKTLNKSYTNPSGSRGVVGLNLVKERDKLLVIMIMIPNCSIKPLFITYLYLAVYFLTLNNQYSNDHSLHGT